MGVVRRRCNVRGRVQGVGFRYHAATCARNRAVTGFVRNQSDSSVVIEAQGSSVELDAFFAEVFAAPPGRVDQYATVDVPAVEGEPGFRVRF